MFLNNENDIMDWLYEYVYISINDKKTKEREIKKYIYFTEENNQIIVNSKAGISLISNSNTLELPIKFGIINGWFKPFGKSLESFKGFPKIIQGDLQSPNCSFKSIKGWEIIEIDGTINLCGKDCELDNLLFLENTKFNELYLKMNDSIFKNNSLPELLKSYAKKDGSNIIIINQKELKKYNKEYKKEYNDLNNYLESFNLVEMDIK